MNPSEPTQEKPNPEPETGFQAVAQKWQNSQSVVAWSIAGFDPSGGAGVTADLLTFAAHGLFGCSAVTALTVQNTCGVFGQQFSTPQQLEATLDRLLEDLPPAGIKIGMLGNPELAGTVARFLARLRATGTLPTVVLDPVLRSSSGAVLFPDEGLSLLRRDILPHVDWATPNWAELAILYQTSAAPPIDSLTAASAAARRLAASVPGLGIIATGGDQSQPFDLVLPPDGTECVLAGRRIETTSTHGTGCAYSSALLCQLIRRVAPCDAARRAKAFVEGALEHAPGLGHGRGPMDLLWPLRHTTPSLLP